MQPSSLHSRTNSPSSLPSSLKISKTRSFTKRISCGWQRHAGFPPFLDSRASGLRGLAVLLSESRQFYPRAPDNPFQLDKEVGVHWIGTRLEGFDRLLARSDQDREQRLRSVLCARFDWRRLSVSCRHTMPRGGVPSRIPHRRGFPASESGEVPLVPKGPRRAFEPILSAQMPSGLRLGWVTVHRERIV
jgi:hypothetical protein